MVEIEKYYNGEIHVDFEKIFEWKNSEDLYKICIKQQQEIKRLHSIIKEVREYIENNSLYEQDYDYDYEENMVEYPPSDEQAKKDILKILDKEK